MKDSEYYINRGAKELPGTWLTTQEAYCAYIDQDCLSAWQYDGKYYVVFGGSNQTRPYAKVRGASTDELNTLEEVSKLIEDLLFFDEEGYDGMFSRKEYPALKKALIVAGIPGTPENVRYYMHREELSLNRTENGQSSARFVDDTHDITIDVETLEVIQS